MIRCKLIMEEIPTFIDAGPEGYETKRFSKLVWRQSNTDKCLQEFNRETSDEEYEPEKDRMKVFLRMRPLLGKEKGGLAPFRVDEDGRKLMVEHEDPAIQKSTSTEDVFQKFIFSKILPESSSQEDVYNTCMSDVISSFQQESNCLTFCYGATNAGKTYTIQGSATSPGIIPRAVKEIFFGIEGSQSGGTMLKPDLHEKLIKLDEEQKRLELHGVSSFLRSHAERQKKLKSSFNASVKSTGSSSDFIMSSTLLSGESGKSLPQFDVSKDAFDELNRCNDSKFVYHVWLSCIEIYNEKISDLLVIYEHKKPRHALKLVKDPKKGTVSVSGVKYIYVRNANDTLSVMSAATDNISFASTRMNERSSRSHCLFSLKVVKAAKESSFFYPRMSTITFCDLAGSERTQKTGNEGVRLKETGSINTSLMVLGRCIRALRAAQRNKEKKKVVIPYRESKLTQLLQSYFEGGGKVSMLVNICPSSLVLEETLQVLKFSAIAQKIVTIPKAKEVVPVAEAKPSMFAHRLSKLTGGKTSFTWATPFKTRTVSINISPDYAALDTVKEEEDADYSKNLNEWKAYADQLEKKIEQLKYKMKKQDLETRKQLTEKFDQKLRKMEEIHLGEMEELHDKADTITQEKLVAFERAQQQYKRERGEEGIEELQEELKIQKKEVERLVDENHAVTDFCKELQRTIEKYSKENQKRMQEKVEMEFTIAALKTNLQDLREASELDEKLVEENMKREQEAIEATDKYLSIKAKVEATEEELRQNSKMMNELRNENVMLVQEAEALQEQARGNTNMIEEYEVKMYRMEDENKKLKIKNVVLEKELKDIRQEQISRQNDEARLKSKQRIKDVREAAGRSPISPKVGFAAETAQLKENLKKAQSEIQELGDSLLLKKKEIVALRFARESDFEQNQIVRKEFQNGKEKLEEEYQKRRKLEADNERLRKELQDLKKREGVVFPFVETSMNTTSGRSRRGRKQAKKESRPLTRSRRRETDENLNPSFLSDDEFVEPPKPAPRNRKLLDAYVPRYTGESSVDDFAPNERKRNLRPRK